ncbi:MAG: pseudouridine synthase [Kouleothrix sp.]
MTAERLQKVLASAGVASRRDCEDLIGAGRVAVNGKVVVVPGTRVDAEHDEITVDGQPIGKINPRTYVMLHKPTGVVSTADDPQGRPTVVEQVGLPTRLFPIGRLDYDSEGLLLLTDDGELTQRLTHPSYQVEKEYRALLDQPPVADALREWRNGVMLDDALTAPAWVEVLERTDEGAWVRVVLHEGRKRQIREVAKLLGYEVLRLIRVREGPIVLGDLPAGQWRKLTDDEVESLWSHVGGHGAEPPAAVERAEAPARARRRTSNPAPDARREREVSGDSPPPAEQSNRAPRRDDRGEFDARGPRRDDRGGFDARGPRRDDRGGFDARGSRRDRGEFDARGPRRDDRGGFDARGPRRATGVGLMPVARADDRGGFDARGPRRDDRVDSMPVAPSR